MVQGGEDYQVYVLFSIYAAYSHHNMDRLET